MAEAPVAAAEAVSFRYGPHLALDRVDLEVRRGEAVAVLGPNGAGKSTLMALLLGLRAPAEGRVAVLGGPPREAARQGRVAAMLQEVSLPAFALVHEVLTFFARLYPRPLEPREAARLAGVEGLLGRPVTRLSGGERRRVQFALLLVANAEFLVLDEPTEGLDLEGRQRLWETVRAHRTGAPGRTVLFTTHDLAEADRFADRILLLARGRAVALGTPEALKRRLAVGRVRFRAPDGVAAEDLAVRTGYPVRAAGDGWLEVETQDTDDVLRRLVDPALGLRDFRVSGGTLEEVFAALTQADRRGAA